MIERGEKMQKKSGGSFLVAKTEPDKMLVFGWANAATRKDGAQVEDLQGDVIDPDELEKAAYDHVLRFRSTGERHDPRLRSKGRLIESCVFTKEKQAAMGIPPGVLGEAWWVGYKIDDPDAWAKIKSGEYKMFSVEGKGKREAIAKSYAEAKEAVEKFNPYHGRDGRFTSPNAAASFTYAPGKSKAHDMAIEREKQRHAESQPKRRELKLDEKAIQRLNDQSLFDGGKVLAADAKRTVDAYDKEFAEKPEWTKEQKEFAAKRRDEYVGLVEEAYNDQIRRRADNPSWAVTGRSGYDFKRHEKKMNAEMNAQQKYSEKMNNFRENTRKGLERLTPEDQQIARWRQGKWKHGETVSPDDPLAQKKLQAKLDYLNESQTNMKAANAYYRKHGSMKGFTGYSEKTNANIDAAMEDMKNRGYRQSKPFESFQLSNNNAQIKATQQRLQQMERQKERANSGGGNGGFNFSGGKVVNNAGNNRLQIVFDEKPSAEIRAQLKANGFRWSPREGAWQRQSTPNAEAAAKRILGDSLEKSVQRVEFLKQDGGIIEFEKFNPYHDRRGRFSTGNAFVTFSPPAATRYRPNAPLTARMSGARKRAWRARSAASS